MTVRKRLLQFAILLLPLTALITLADNRTASKVETLSNHETVAVFEGTRLHRCIGLTSLCPDRCGHSGTLATFKIVKYLKYEKTGKYGDPQGETFVFMLENNLKQAKAPLEIRETVAGLKPGDTVLLSWNHDYVTRGGSSSPERPVKKLERIAAPGSDAWLQQIEAATSVTSGDDTKPETGSDEWKKIVSRKLQLHDETGQGPLIDSDKWQEELHRKVFGISPARPD